MKKTKNEIAIALHKSQTPFTISGVWIESPNGDIWNYSDDTKVFGIINVGDTITADCSSTCEMFSGRTEMSRERFGNWLRFSVDLSLPTTIIKKGVRNV